MNWWTDIADQGITVISKVKFAAIRALIAADLLPSVICPLNSKHATLLIPSKPNNVNYISLHICYQF